VAAADAAKKAIKEQVVTVASDDPAMNAAIKRARETLPAFWAAMGKPGPGEKDFSIKMAISEGSSTEHFWLIDVKREDGKLMGTINNEPETVKTAGMGQRVEIVEGRITDWMYKRKGKMVGNETMRPLLKAMSKDEAAPYWAMYEKP
jgi:uncharacterized protein YegJ (DUF2314 family)